MNDSYRKALDGIKDACPSGTRHPNDYARVVHIFKELTENGKFVSDPNIISDYLKQNGVDPDQSDKIQEIYEVFESAAKDTPGWSDDFLKDVLA